ncbi:MAG: hypothetical protein ABJA78_16605 [Ferruginibacter sp.]
MENLSFKNITDFVEYFGLKSAEGAIVFNADIVINKTGESKTVESEVHIITSNRLMTVYLLDDAIADMGIAEMYPAVNYAIVYIPSECLKINIDEGEKPVSIAVYPKTRKYSR